MTQSPELMPREQLQAFKGLVNELRGGLEIPREPSIKRTCRSLYGRPIGERTWQRWKATAIATHKPWDYADGVCLRLIAIGRAGNGRNGGHARFTRAMLANRLHQFLTHDDGEQLLVPSRQMLTGAELQQRIRESLGHNYSDRHLRRFGVYRRRMYSPSSIERITEQILLGA